jgi:hypothetical protein
MFVVRSPRGTFLLDEGLRDDRFASWSFDRRKATVITPDEYDDLRKDWPYLNACDLVPALLAARVA